MPFKSQVRRNDLVEPELSYEIVGSVFDVFNQLGPGLRESTYQKAIAQKFTQLGLPFKQQIYFPIMYQGKRVGWIRLDFIVAQKIVLELKRGEYFSRSNIQQVKEYIEVTGLSLAILINITQNGVRFRRIVNFKKRDGTETKNETKNNSYIRS